MKRSPVAFEKQQSRVFFGVDASADFCLPTI